MEIKTKLMLSKLGIVIGLILITSPLVAGISLISLYVTISGFLITMCSTVIYALLKD